MTPNNPLGHVDLFMATHHGLDVSNNPVMVLALDPHVCVTCNGPVKGAAANTIATLKRVKSLEEMYQLHRNVKLADADQAPAANIANAGRRHRRMQGGLDQVLQSLKISVQKSYTVQIGAEGQPRVFRDTVSS